MSSPGQESEAKRHDSDEQAFTDPRRADLRSAREDVEKTVGENPAAVQTDRKPERSRANARIGENAREKKQGRKSGENKERFAKLIQGMSDRNEPGHPGDRCDRFVWCFEKVKDGEEYGSKDDGRHA